MRSHPSPASSASQRTQQQQQPRAAAARSTRRGLDRLSCVLLAVGAAASALPGGLAFSPSCSLRAGPGGSSPPPICRNRPESSSVVRHHAAGGSIDAGSWAGVTAAAAAWVVLPLAFAVGSPAMAAEDLSTGPLRFDAQKGKVGITLEGRPRVVDGDTLVFESLVAPDGKKERVRLLGIDAPETKQICTDSGGAGYKCGEEAQAFLKGIIGTDQVKCLASKRDQYSRVLGVCFDERTGKDLNREMVKAGEAVAYAQFSKAYVGEEDGPRAAKKGMWRGEFAQPWDYRKAKRAGGATVGGGAAAKKGVPAAVKSATMGNSAVKSPTLDFSDPWDDLSE